MAESRRCSNVRCRRRDQGPFYLVLVGWRYVGEDDGSAMVQVVLCELCAEKWPYDEKGVIVEDVHGRKP